MLFPKSKKAKPPIVRIIATSNESSNSFEVSNVDSIDKVFWLLSHMMNVTTVSSDVRDALHYKHKGNAHLKAGKVDLAINAYRDALEALNATHGQQRGLILLQHASALLQRAKRHQETLRAQVNSLLKQLPTKSALQTLHQNIQESDVLRNVLLHKLDDDTKQRETAWRRVQYQYGLYQYALLQAAKDAVEATGLLPKYVGAYLCAAEALSCLWKVKESEEYYEQALELAGNSLESTSLMRLKRQQELLAALSQNKEWSEETLRLALDVSEEA